MQAYTGTLDASSLLAVLKRLGADHRQIANALEVVGNSLDEICRVVSADIASTTHDMWHVAEELSSADTMGFVAMDAPLVY